MTLPLTATRRIHNATLTWHAITQAIGRAERNLQELQPGSTEATRNLLDGHPADTATRAAQELDRLTRNITHQLDVLARWVLWFDYPTAGEYNPDGPRLTLTQWVNQLAPQGCNNCAEHGVYSVRRRRRDEYGEWVDDGTRCTDCHNFHRATTFERTPRIIEAQDKGYLNQTIVDDELRRLKQAANATKRKNQKTNSRKRKGPTMMTLIKEELKA